MFRNFVNRYTLLLNNNNLKAEFNFNVCGFAFRETEIRYMYYNNEGIGFEYQTYWKLKFLKCRQDFT